MVKTRVARRSYRRRRAYRRRPTRMYRRPLTTRPRNLVSYKREFFKAQVGGGGGGAAYEFKLTDLPNSGTFINMYDEYRIMAVVFKYVPYINSNATMSLGDTFLATHVIGMDFNDSITPGTRDDVLKLKYHKQFSFGRRFTYMIKPSIAVSLYNSIFTTGYGLGSRKMWISTTSAAIPYYSLKTWYTNSSVSQPFVGEIYMTYYVQFRGVQL